MLVISRRQNESLVFPKLGITIHIGHLDGKRVRVGVEAPRDVHVLRSEIVDAGRYEPRERVAASKSAHETQNRLHTALLSLHLLQRKAERREVTPEQVEAAVRDIAARLESVEAQCDSAMAGPPEMLASAAKPEGSPRRKALVVEDNSNERSLLAGCLRAWDYDVSTASDGADALLHLQQHEAPDVVLLDMNMPRMDGAATIREIRSNPAWEGLKVIAVTGNQRPSDEAVGPRGVDHWFQKPVHPERLLAEIERELATCT